jgi:hypothetical protein
MLGNSLGLSMADQMDGCTLELRDGSTLDIVDLAGLLVDGNAPLQQVIGDPCSLRVFVR